MAQYRLSSQVIGRSTGRSAVAAAAYRSGQSLADERTGQIHDFSRKGGVLNTEIMAPDDAPEWMHDRARLWNAVEIAERRKDAQLAREVQLSLPHELDDAQRLDLVRGFVHSQFVALGMVADFAIHTPGREGDDRNHHAHIMLTMRELMGEGFGNKARDWNSPELLQTWREEWATQQNAALEKHGFPSRVDHRSFEAQGIDREPTLHLGPHAGQMEQRGKESRLGDENRAIDGRNTDRASNAQSAVLINLDIERHRRQHDAATAAKVHTLEDVLRLSEIDLARRFDRQRADLDQVHAEQYGRHEGALRSELAAIDERARSTGWRKVLRTVTGSVARDKWNAERMGATLADIAQRKAESFAALKVRQDAERAAVTTQHREKIDALKVDLAKQGAKRERDILAAQRRQQWQEKREAKKDAAHQQSERPTYRRNVELSPEQKAKQLERQDRNRARDLAPEMPPRSTPPEIQPMKREFDDARRHERPTVEKAPTKAQLVANPAPAPSPAGEVPRQAKQFQQVPVKTPPKSTEKAPVAPRRDFVTKAPPTPPKAPTPSAGPKKDWAAAAKTPTPSPAPKKDWSKSAAPAQATPATSPASPQTPAPKKDWSQSATPADKPVVRPAPQRSRDRDRDME